MVYFRLILKIFLLFILLDIGGDLFIMIGELVILIVFRLIEN